MTARPASVVAGALALLAATFAPARPASATSPYLEIPPKEVAEASASYRYAQMTEAEALAELDRRKVPYRRLKRVAGVRTPVRLTGKLHGVDIHGALPKEQREHSIFEVVDARFLLALDDFAQLLAKHDIVEVVHFTMYRPNGPKPGSKEEKEYLKRLREREAKARGDVPRRGAKRSRRTSKRTASKPKRTSARKPKRGSKASSKPKRGGSSKASSRPKRGSSKASSKPKRGTNKPKRKGTRSKGSKPGRKHSLRKVAGALHAAVDLSRDVKLQLHERIDGHSIMAGEQLASDKAKRGDKLRLHLHDHICDHSAMAGEPLDLASDKAKRGGKVRKARQGKHRPKPLRKKLWAPPGTRHPAGLAIDVGFLVKRDGRRLSVAQHFRGHIGAQTCGPKVPAPKSAQARELRSLVCEARDLGIFTYVLTPNYDRAHADHFHMEIRSGVRWFLYH